MLTEYRVLDKEGIPFYFIDDERRAKELQKQGFDVQARINDPFAKHKFKTLDQSVGARRSAHLIGKTKYSYETCRQIFELNEKGVTSRQIGIRLGVTYTIVHQVVNQARPAFTNYRERYNEETRRI
jgi:hypothetical protein